MNRSPIKYVFFDLDGTLLDDQKNISLRTIGLIKEFREQYGVKFGLASGRALTSLLPLIDKFQMGEIIDAIVANNGVELFIPKQNLLIEMPKVSATSIQEIVDYYRKYPFINVAFHNPHKLYAVQRNERVEYILRINGISKCLSPLTDKNFIDTPRVMLLLSSYDDAKIANLLDGVKFKGLKGYLSDRESYEYMVDGVSKDLGIQSFVSMYKDSLENVMVFGDNDNDVEMIKNCGIGVAMKNGSNSSKKNADMITEDDNNLEGVYKFMDLHREYFIK